MLPRSEQSLVAASFSSLFPSTGNMEELPCFAGDDGNMGSDWRVLGTYCFSASASLGIDPHKRTSTLT